MSKLLVGKCQATIYPEGNGYIGAISLGFDGKGNRQRFAIYVRRSVRADGDTKTQRSRRTLELPTGAAEALREHRARQAKERLAAGPAWKDHGLVFASQAGTPARQSPRRSTGINSSR